MLATRSARYVGTTILILAALAVLGPTAVRADLGDCGQPVTDGPDAVATDARFVLATAVGAEACPRCVCDVNDSGAVNATDALEDLQNMIGLPVSLTCPACSEEAQCPGVAQFALLAGLRNLCSSNADCGGFPCDPTAGRCRTATRLDTGWTGAAHRSDLNDIVPARLFLDCQGPAPCGSCDIVGLDPVLGNCRCASDNRIPCFTPEAPDETFCGGERCECYFGPPTPLSAGNAPTCLVNRLASTPTGTIDVDAGAGVISLELDELVHLGVGLTQPCPFCDGDAVPADGSRDGLCVGGLNNGESCDAQSANTTFPAPGGGRHSLDCFPSPSQNISGLGIGVSLDLSTGQTVQPFGLSCGLLGQPDVMCPCRMCSGDSTVPCGSDQECADIGAGTCTSNGSGVTPRPNSCTDGVCEQVGPLDGRCMTGPDTRFCDGIVRADGRGFITCQANADCTAAVPAGDCTIVERRACFLDPIVSVGFAHPVVPVGADVFCVGPTSNLGINSTAGLPGPTRWSNQAQLTNFCSRAPATSYQPGVGGCPPADP